MRIFQPTISGSVTVTENLIVLGGITGSISGSINNALSASYALTASHIPGLSIDKITSGSVEASVLNTGNLFIIKSGSSVFQQVDLTGSTTFTTDANTVFLIKNFGNNPIFTVSQSGMVILATQSVELANPALVGGIYFTSNSLFIGLE